MKDAGGIARSGTALVVRAVLALRVDAEEWAESEQLVILDDALRALEQRCTRLARVFECRYFAGLGEEETAEALGISLRSVQRAWREARRWLAERLV